MARNRQRNRSSRSGATHSRSSSRETQPQRREDAAVEIFGQDEDDPLEALEAPGGGRGGGGGRVGTATAAFGRPDEASSVPPEAVEHRPRGNPIERVLEFFRNCWAELQRVQWPDRQQVAQATSVVLGFVVLTGVFLGICDYVAGKLINWIV
jgi:preprotein translocase subunit SecE